MIFQSGLTGRILADGDFELSTRRYSKAHGGILWPGLEVLNTAGAIIRRCDTGASLTALDSVAPQTKLLRIILSARRRNIRRKPMISMLPRATTASTNGMRRLCRYGQFCAT
jgi:hypothetical protein